MSRGIQEEFGQSLNIFDDQGLTEASLHLRSVTAVRLPSAPPLPLPPLQTWPCSWHHRHGYLPFHRLHSGVVTGGWKCRTKRSCSEDLYQSINMIDVGNLVNPYYSCKVKYSKTEYTSWIEHVWSQYPMHSCFLREDRLREVLRMMERCEGGKQDKKMPSILERVSVLATFHNCWTHRGEPGAG